MLQPQYPVQFQPEPPGRGLAIASLVLAAAALVAVLGVVGFLAVGGAGSWAPLTGQVAVRGGSLPGDDLAAEVREKISNDGGTPSQMRCPDTPAVRQSVTTVCHGVVDDADWAVVVFFEDASGTYTLLPV